MRRQATCETFREHSTNIHSKHSLNVPRTFTECSGRGLSNTERTERFYPSANIRGTNVCYVGWVRTYAHWTIKPQKLAKNQKNKSWTLIKIIRAQ